MRGKTHKTMETPQNSSLQCKISTYSLTIALIFVTERTIFLHCWYPEILTPLLSLNLHLPKSEGTEICSTIIKQVFSFTSPAAI